MNSLHTYKYFKDLQLIKADPGNVFNLFMLKALIKSKVTPLEKRLKHHWNQLNLIILN